MGGAYVGRLAPSPTGLLHLGHAATFLVAWERAVAASGRLLLRNEDLDRDRVRTEFVTAMVADLKWLGIGWEQPAWVQSERGPVYRAAVERLLAMGLAFPCWCSRRELATMVGAPHEEEDDEPVYLGRCRPAGVSGDGGRSGGVRLNDREEAAMNAAPGLPTADPDGLRDGVNYRFRVPDGAVVEFVDGRCGPQAFRCGCEATADFGDFLVWRKDGLPSYQLACVVDDAAMGVTEVVRGRDLLKSTARQMLLQRALGLDSPAYFHTELLRDAAGVRLAKRHDSMAVRRLREDGWTRVEVLTAARGGLSPTASRRTGGKPRSGST